MHAKTAKFLQLAAEEMGIDEYVQIRDDYSGRHMYGDKTHAIVCDPQNIYELIATAAIRVYEDSTANGEHDESGERYGTEEFIADCGNFRRDNMGRDDIVLY